MGLITHNTAITDAEAKHGHRCTYTLDTLERDAVAAGLQVIHRSGIFFKALANFQWDRLLQTDIISREYLEGCFKLGMQVPRPLLQYLSCLHQRQKGWGFVEDFSFITPRLLKPLIEKSGFHAWQFQFQSVSVSVELPTGTPGLSRNALKVCLRRKPRSHLKFALAKMIPGMGPARYAWNTPQSIRISSASFCENAKTIS